MNLNSAVAAIVLGSLGSLVVTPGAAAQVTDLEAGFADPPAVSRPHTWWHWMNGNITREGITADLEAMKQIGLGGAQIFNVSESIPPGPVAYMSDEWLALVKHAASEAQRLGIELCMHNCAGWSSSGGPWVTPEHAMQMVVVSETQATGPAKFEAVLAQPETRKGYYRDIAVLAFPTPRDGGARIKDIGPKAGFEARYGLQPALDEYPADAIIGRAAVVYLTDKLSKDGRLTWEVPAGSWTILRFGHTPTGKDNHPSPESGRGLECDKLSREAFDAFWSGGMAKVIKQLGPLAGKVLNNCLIDSYEVGHQNWTARFREEFIKRRGYDPIVLLPVLTGRVIDSGEISERFLWDFRRTIADLFADNYYGYFAELCHKAGMQASIEPYDGPFEGLQSGRDADIPMGEFWVGSGAESNSCKLAASVAHIYGRKIVGAESFTADPNTGRWQNDPASLKAIGDLMYTVGINRYIVHRYAHQPWMDRYPGMTMGQWGTHFERTVTWWEQGAAWVQYLSRCQFMLQQGLFAADVALFAGDGAPSGAPHDPALKAAGYDYDAIGPDVLLNRMSVKDGRLVLPDGMSYRVLVLPDSQGGFMTPRVLGKLKELVKAGATVIGPRPSRSPSLSDYPRCDQEVQKLAAELWGDCDGKAVKEHAFGKGKVVWGRTAPEVLGAMGIGPDCSLTAGGAKAPSMAWIHRIVDKADVYFISNQSGRAREVECSFRIAGRLPELWHADTGLIETAPLWNESGGRTTVPIRFDATGSVFVVFAWPSAAWRVADHFVSMTSPAEGAAPATPKIEIKRAHYEAVDGAGGVDVTEKVTAMVAAGETSIAASNANFGDPTYLHVKRLTLEYLLDGKALTASAPENTTLDLVAPPGPAAPPEYTLAHNEHRSLLLAAFKPGAYEFTRASGRTVKKDVAAVPEPVEIAGPWTLKFASGWGAPPGITLDTLASWTEHPDAGVKYFSGTAEYEKEFDLSQDLVGSGKALVLDLAEVKNLAQVSLNGKDLGVLWKPPFAIDISGAARSGKNVLKVRVTNLWMNRLIGDEQYPDDCEWNGKPLKAWPQWLVEGKPRPVKERLTFTTWKHWAKDSPLLPSGLLGPVVVRVGQVVKVE